MPDAYTFYVNRVKNLFNGAEIGEASGHASPYTSKVLDCVDEQDLDLRNKKILCLVREDRAFLKVKHYTTSTDIEDFQSHIL